MIPDLTLTPLVEEQCEIQWDITKQGVTFIFLYIIFCPIDAGIRHTGLSYWRSFQDGSSFEKFGHGEQISPR